MVKKSATGNSSRSTPTASPTADDDRSVRSGWRYSSIVVETIGSAQGRTGLGEGMPRFVAVLKLGDDDRGAVAHCSGPGAGAAGLVLF